MKLKPLEEQVVVIVGATSGIGRAAALSFAARGARVVLSARSERELNSLAAEIASQGGDALVVPADVSDFSQVKAIADGAVAAFGRIDTWVHTAAVMMYSAFSQTTPAEFKQILDVNLMGQVYGAMAALPYIKREGRGALIHISSVEARRSLPLQSAYAASKRAMLGFLDALRMELEHEGWPIGVVNVMPSSINTPLFGKALTRLGVKPMPVPPLYQPEIVAKTILDAAEHPQRDLIAGGTGKALALLQRLSPRITDKLLMRIAFRGQRSSQPKSASAPNNLFQHLDGFDRVRGDYDHLAKPFSLYTWWARNRLAGGALLGALAAALILANRSRSRG